MNTKAQMKNLNSETFLQFKDYVRQSRSFAVTGLTSFLRVLLVKTAIETSKKKFLLITSTEQNALKFQNDFKKAFDIESQILPFQDVSVYEGITPNLYEYSEQIKILRQESKNVRISYRSIFRQARSSDLS